MKPRYRIQVGIYRFYAVNRTAEQVREDLRELPMFKEPTDG